MQIIKKQSKYEYWVPTSWYGFPCDKDGNISEVALPEEMRSMLRRFRKSGIMGTGVIKSV